MMSLFSSAYLFSFFSSFLFTLHICLKILGCTADIFRGDMIIWGLLLSTRWNTRFVNILLVYSMINWIKCHFLKSRYSLFF